MYYFTTNPREAEDMVWMGHTGEYWGGAYEDSKVWGQLATCRKCGSMLEMRMTKLRILTYCLNEQCARFTSWRVVQVDSE